MTGFSSLTFWRRLILSFLGILQKGAFFFKPLKLYSFAGQALEVFYRTLVRPPLQGKCRFFPSCFVYARQCFATHSFLRACFLTSRRLLRCHPWGACGEDPVPSSPQSLSKSC